MKILSITSPCTFAIDFNPGCTTLQGMLGADVGEAGDIASKKGPVTIEELISATSR
jgi:hypothetical protein